MKPRRWPGAPLLAGTQGGTQGADLVLCAGIRGQQGKRLRVSDLVRLRNSASGLPLIIDERETTTDMKMPAFLAKSIRAFGNDHVLLDMFRLSVTLRVL